MLLTNCTTCGNKKSTSIKNKELNNKSKGLSNISNN